MEILALYRTTKKFQPTVVRLLPILIKQWCDELQRFISSHCRRDAIHDEAVNMMTKAIQFFYPIPHKGLVNVNGIDESIIVYRLLTAASTFCQYVLPFCSIQFDDPSLADDGDRMVRAKYSLLYERKTGRLVPLWRSPLATPMDNNNDETKKGVCMRACVECAQ
jgi:hypothetical protein